jgi:hypothetical protein
MDPDCNLSLYILDNNHSNMTWKVKENIHWIINLIDSRSDKCLFYAMNLVSEFMKYKWLYSIWCLEIERNGCFWLPSDCLEQLLYLVLSQTKHMRQFFRHKFSYPFTLSRSLEK